MTKNDFSVGCHELKSCALCVHVQELDEQLYEDCKRQWDEQRQESQLFLEQRDQKWQVLQQVALQRAPKWVGVMGLVSGQWGSEVAALAAGCIATSAKVGVGTQNGWRRE